MAASSDPEHRAGPRRWVRSVCGGHGAPRAAAGAVGPDSGFIAEMQGSPQGGPCFIRGKCKWGRYKSPATERPHQLQNRRGRPFLEMQTTEVAPLPSCQLLSWMKDTRTGAGGPARQHCAHFSTAEDRGTRTRRPVRPSGKTDSLAPVKDSTVFVRKQPFPPPRRPQGTSHAVSRIPGTPWGREITPDLTSAAACHSSPSR
ncbi:uncharacterized protein LOC106731049 isoform X2 [Camelus ferus]|uniref:Uncharacterized protein LOC106731049 isoform X2 n=1 Tax=Camelus ferus TaxID=419612 RepID=A0A8B8SLT0_CAMFR|nr:uncharacterized protein LOC106731049 isoform X2 [Camelus ferus]